MDKVLLFGWMSEVHKKRDSEGVLLPNVPALAMFFQFSNEFCWSDLCFQEVLSLEMASGISFADYCRQLQQPPMLHGTSPLCPIIIDEDTVHEESFHSAWSAPWSYSFRSSDCSLTSSQDSSPAPVSTGGGVLVPSDAEDVTSQENALESTSSVSAASQVRFHQNLTQCSFKITTRIYYLHVNSN